MKVPFSPPDISNAEIEEVVKTLKSGWITTGPKTKLFEEKIAGFCHVERAVCLNSATACLEATLRLLDIGLGDEVITSAYTYTASASPVCHVGARLKLIDTKKDSYEMDYNQLEKAINENTKVIIPVDLGGVPCDYDKIFEIVEKKKKLFQPKNEIQKAIGRVIVISDAAHAFGAKWKGMMCGEIADFTSFSFHAVKNLTTAEGGAVTWRNIPGISNEWIYQQYMLLSLHGQSKDALAKTKIGSWEYDIVTTAYKYNMTDIMAAIGLKQFERYPDLLKRRKQIIQCYEKALIPYGVSIMPHYTNNYTSSGHLMLIRIPLIKREERDKIIIEMAEMGVATNVHYKPLPMMTAYKTMGFDIANYPNAMAQFENEITLPLHTCLDDEQVDYVIQCMEKVLNKHGRIKHEVNIMGKTSGKNEK